MRYTSRRCRGILLIPMPSTKIWQCILALLIALLAIYSVYNYMIYDHNVLVGYGYLNVAINEAKTLKKSINDSQAMEIALRVVNAPKLLQTMHQPRERFRFIIEPRNAKEKPQKGMFVFVEVIIAKYINRKTPRTKYFVWGTDASFSIA